MPVSFGKIDGLQVISPVLYSDERGEVLESYGNELKSKIDAKNLEQTLISTSSFGVLRGFHYQSEPCKEAKTISCLNGEIYDVIIDLRKSSPTYLDHCSVKISSNNKKSIHIPYGCANAWITTMSNTIIHYYMSDPYSPNYGQGIRYNDPFFKISWPMEPNLISEKDLNYTDFDKNKHIN